MTVQRRGLSTFPLGEGSSMIDTAAGGQLKARGGSNSLFSLPTNSQEGIILKRDFQPFIHFSRGQELEIQKIKSKMGTRGCHSHLILKQDFSASAPLTFGAPL